MGRDRDSGSGAEERIELSFRPASYFGPRSLRRHTASRINGRVRRGAVERALGAGEDVPAALLESTLDPDTLAAVTSIHPQLLGGEFLPPYAEGEVEIASVSLRSTTADQVSVRARMAGGRILYRVVDEYEGEYIADDWEPRSSCRPLTLGQLIGLIDAAYDVFEIAHTNMEGGADRESMEEFVTVSSAFYPQLELHYAEMLDAFLEDNYPVEEEDGDVEDVEVER